MICLGIVNPHQIKMFSSGLLSHLCQSSDAATRKMMAIPAVVKGLLRLVRDSHEVIVRHALAALVSFCALSCPACEHR